MIGIPVLSMHQSFNGDHNILDGIKRNFTIRNFDIEFLFEVEQEFNLIQGVESDALDGCFG